MYSRHNKRYTNIIILMILFVLLAIITLHSLVNNRKIDDIPIINEQNQDLLVPQFLAESIIIKEKEVLVDLIEEENNTIMYYREDVPLSLDLQQIVYSSCEEYNVDYNLVFGLIQCESNFDENAKSSVGCYGLMQLHPKYFPKDLDAAGNLKVGIEFLSSLLAKYGDTAAALRAYNKGHDDGDRVYSNKVLNYAKQWKESEILNYG